MRQGPNSQKNYRWIREVLETIVLTLLMFLIIHFAVQNYRVDGQSMEPTLHDQELILVDKASYLFHPPQRGDVIIFHYPLNPHVDYVKRIIAVPGDIISVAGETITVDGVTLNEPYINKDDPGNPFRPFTNRIVPPDDYFVMGDNRGNSSDSRQWGFVPREKIVGKAAIIYWPFGVNNFGLLPNVDSVFAKVHQ